MPAAWARLELKAIPAPGMMMGTAAKKHLTIFYRRKHAKGAGRLAVKKKFAEVAAKTGGIPLRADRIAIVKKEMLAAGLKTEKYYKRSRSHYAPLSGKFYVLSKGETVGSAIARRGLEAILSAGRTD
jgi:hypothetical protein